MFVFLGVIGLLAPIKGPVRTKVEKLEQKMKAYQLLNRNVQKNDDENVTITNQKCDVDSEAKEVRIVETKKISIFEAIKLRGEKKLYISQNSIELSK